MLTILLLIFLWLFGLSGIIYESDESRVQRIKEVDLLQHGHQKSSLFYEAKYYLTSHLLYNSDQQDLIQIKQNFPDLLPSAKSDSDSGSKTIGSKNSRDFIDCSQNLASQMLSYATLYGIARSIKYKPLIPHGNLLEETFGHNLYAEVAERASFHKLHFTSFAAHSNLDYDARYFSIPIDFVTIDSHVVLMGEFSSWRYFQRFDPEILNQFQFSDFLYLSIRNSVENEKRQCKKNNCTLVGVSLDFTPLKMCEHLASRCRTQLNNEDGKKDLLKEINKEFLLLAIRYLSFNHPRIHLLILTNEISLLQHVLRNYLLSIPSAFTFTLFDNRRLTEADSLDLLLSCEHVVFNGGLLPFWAAYLLTARNPLSRTIYCASESPNHAKHFHNLFFPTWVPLYPL